MIKEVSDTKQIFKLCDYFSLKQLESMANSNHVILGYYIENELIGFTILLNLNIEWELIYLFVDNLHRRKKIASKLLYFSLNQYIKSNPLFIEVKKNNVTAINLYIRYEAKLINERKKYYKDGQDALIFRIN